MVAAMIRLRPSFIAAPAPLGPRWSCAFDIACQDRAGALEGRLLAADHHRQLRRLGDAGVEPETGASIISHPALGAERRQLARGNGPIVLISTSTRPGAAPARIPSGPSSSARTASASATIVTTTSAPAASSAGVAATLAPSASSGSALLGAVKDAQREAGGAARCAPSAAPMRPDPAKPT